MKKLQINPSSLEIRTASMSFGKNFCAVKLSQQEAFAFNSANFHNFDELLASYGANNQLKEGELYNGYIAALSHWGRAEIVVMRGKIRRIDPKTAVGCLNYSLADAIAKGMAWECVYPLEGGKTTSGTFNYVWTFRDCQFARHIIWCKQRGVAGFDELDAYATDKMIKDKIVEALQSEEKIVELSETEEMVLKMYLGTSYYTRFFCEVE